MRILIELGLLALLLLALVALNGCSSDEGPAQPTTGKLIGVVTSAASGAGLAGVRVSLFDANTNAPLGTLGTQADGSYGIDIAPGIYVVKFAKQGYEALPPKDVSALPVTVQTGQTSTHSVQMFPSPSSNTGAFSGRVLSGGAPAIGVLVVAESGPAGYSAVTDVFGNYAVFNVPAGSYAVKAWRSGSTSTQTSVAVVANAEQKNVDLVLTPGAPGSVTGHVTFLATTNIEVDVVLLNPNSREAIPGLSTTTVGQNFVLQNVPDGIYLARATYKNDGKVVDPDWIIKNGEPLVTVSGDAAERDFSVTGSVELLAPSNIAASTVPVDVAGSTPTLSWVSYPSADEYVVEVVNQSGKVIWGGFEAGWTIRNVVVPKTQTSIVFNNDSTATEQLAPGRIYRWKIYASRSDSQEPNGWRLISASEDQRGLMRIVP